MQPLTLRFPIMSLWGTGEIMTGWTPPPLPVCLCPETRREWRPGFRNGRVGICSPLWYRSRIPASMMNALTGLQMRKQKMPGRGLGVMWSTWNSTIRSFWDSLTGGAALRWRFSVFSKNMIFPVRPLFRSAPMAQEELQGASGILPRYCRIRWKYWNRSGYTDRILIRRSLLSMTGWTVLDIRRIWKA